MCPDYIKNYFETIFMFSPIQGNGVTLMHVHEPLSPDQEVQRDVRFWPGQWYKSVFRFGNGRIDTQSPASREEIMMVLEDMDLLLIRWASLTPPKDTIVCTLFATENLHCFYSFTNLNGLFYIIDGDVWQLVV